MAGWPHLSQPRHKFPSHPIPPPTSPPQEMQMLSSLLPAVPKRPPNVGGHEKLKRTLLSTLAPAALGTKSYHR